MRRPDEITTDLDAVKAAPLHKDHDGAYRGPASTSYALCRLIDDIPHLLAEQQPSSALADMLARYLETRQHTLSTAHLPYKQKIRGEGVYVQDEATELREAVDHYVDLLSGWQSSVTIPEAAAHVRHELADVVLAATVLAGFLGTTVEACIAEKTELDRGRG